MPSEANLASATNALALHRSRSAVVFLSDFSAICHSLANLEQDFLACSSSLFIWTKWPDSGGGSFGVIFQRFQGDGVKPPRKSIGDLGFLCATIFFRFSFQVCLACVVRLHLDLLKGLFPLLSNMVRHHRCGVTGRCLRGFSGSVNHPISYSLQSHKPALDSQGTPGICVRDISAQARRSSPASDRPLQLPALE